MVVSSDVEDHCPLCLPSGPPLPSSTKQTSASANSRSLVETGPDLFWISCGRCQKWYHSVCLLLADGRTRETVPEEVRMEIDANHREESAWTNWVGWVDRWYCLKCILWAVDPKNKRPPHHPLVPTLKRGFPPTPKLRALPSSVSQTSLKRSPSSIPVNDQRSPSVSKRSRRESSRKSQAESEDIVEQGRNGHRPLDSENRGDTNDDNSEIDGDSGSSRDAMAIENTEVNEGGSGTTNSRPKRQATLNRLDYHALHHSIATPTGKWLELIHNPEKYGKTIKEGGFPRLPGRLVSRAWIESSAPRHVVADGALADPSRHSSPLPSVPAGPSQPFECPPHLPPTLFYGSQRQPLIIGAEEGGFESLGGRLPGKDLTVREIARLVGQDRMVDVIDVATQSSAQWTLAKWAESIAAHSRPPEPSSTPKKVYNIISLEITGTELAKRVRPPQLVREVDWVDNYWHFGQGGKSGDADLQPGDAKSQANGPTDVRFGEKAKGKADWPKVQLYCLMGMRGSWTDWHVDFAGSSVYYTVHTGAKTFFFIRPTESNLAAYADWSGSYEKQQQEWLGDMCDEVRKVTLHAGDTMIIPSGYIHAVYTPIDSIVFGGNFLHSYDIPTQLRLRQIEIDTKVPQRFRFPQFDKLCWYVAERYCADLRQVRAYRPRTQSAASLVPHSRILEGLHQLATFLLAQIAILEDAEADDKQRKAVYDKIPNDVVRDPSGLAKELEWRVEREMPNGTIDEETTRIDEKPSGGKSKGLVAVKKKQRGAMPISRTWQFDPNPWNQTEQPPEISSSTVIRNRPETDLTSIYTDAEQAIQEQIITRQTRNRAGQLDDGTTVLEEQDVVFTERRTVWDPRRVRSAEPELKHGHGEIEIGHERMMAAIEDSKILEEPVHG